MEDDIQVAPQRSNTIRVSQAAELAESTERKVLRFPAHARREIRRLMRTYAHTDDLCDTFPGLLYALAVRHGTASQRLAALSAIEAGQ
ncbi:MAG: hypothetical protein ABL907_19195, partial [Hyphomicrobium sp.]